MERNYKSITIIGISNIPIIQKGDNLAEIIFDLANKQGTPIEEDDILVVTEKIISKSEGNVVSLKNVEPSFFAKTIAEKTGKSPELVELILRESKSIIRMSNKHLITETRHGWICANSAIDVSNVSGGDSVALLPKDPNVSAQQIRKRIQELTGKNVAVIVSDTFGRPLRRGHIDIAIGASGIDPLWDRKGEEDLFGYILRVKQTAIGDELASAAELVIGNVREKTPVAIIRGYNFPHDEDAKATKLIMPKEKSLFI